MYRGAPAPKAVQWQGGPAKPTPKAHKRPAPNSWGGKGGKGAKSAKQARNWEDEEEGAEDGEAAEEEQEVAEEEPEEEEEAQEDGDDEGWQGQQQKTQKWKGGQQQWLAQQPQKGKSAKGGKGKPGQQQQQPQKNWKERQEELEKQRKEKQEEMERLKEQRRLENEKKQKVTAKQKKFADAVKEDKFEQSAEAIDELLELDMKPANELLRRLMESAAKKAGQADYVRVVSACAKLQMKIDVHFFVKILVFLMQRGKMAFLAVRITLNMVLPKDAPKIPLMPPDKNYFEDEAEMFEDGEAIVEDRKEAEKLEAEKQKKAEEKAKKAEEEEEKKKKEEEEKQEWPPKELVFAYCESCAMLNGTYSRADGFAEYLEHDRPVYKKGEEPKEIFTYYWYDKEAPWRSGWWLGSEVGGDMVCGFNPDSYSEMPPAVGWQINKRDEIDGSFGRRADPGGFYMVDPGPKQVEERPLPNDVEEVIRKLDLTALHGMVVADDEKKLAYFSHFCTLLHLEHLCEIASVRRRLEQRSFEQLKRWGWTMADLPVKAIFNQKFKGRPTLPGKSDAGSERVAFQLPRGLDTDTVRFRRGDSVVISETDPLKDPVGEGMLLEFGDYDEAQVQLEGAHMPQDARSRRWRLDKSANRTAYERQLTALLLVAKPPEQAKSGGWKGQKGGWKGGGGPQDNWGGQPPWWVAQQLSALKNSKPLIDILTTASVGVVDAWAEKMKDTLEKKTEEKMKQEDPTAPKDTEDDWMQFFEAVDTEIDKAKEAVSSGPTVSQLCESCPQEKNLLKNARKALSKVGALNITQRTAVNAALSRRCTIVQGPPGTGKTHVSVALLRLFARELGQSPLLATSDSNVAVDNIAEGLVRGGVKVIRVGRPEKVQAHLEEYTLERKLKSYKQERETKAKEDAAQLKEDMAELEKKRKAAEAKLQRETAERAKRQKLQNEQRATRERKFKEDMQSRLEQLEEERKQKMKQLEAKMQKAAEEREKRRLAQEKEAKAAEEERQKAKAEARAMESKKVKAKAKKREKEAKATTKEKAKEKETAKEQAEEKAKEAATEKAKAKASEAPKTPEKDKTATAAKAAASETKATPEAFTGRPSACRECGNTEMEDNEKFCSDCGAPLRPCPSCNQPNKVKAKFCAGCGLKFEEVSVKEEPVQSKEDEPKETADAVKEEGLEEKEEEKEEDDDSVKDEMTEAKEEDDDEDKEDDAEMKADADDDADTEPSEEDEGEENEEGADAEADEEKAKAEALRIKEKEEEEAKSRKEKEEEEARLLKEMEEEEAKLREELEAEQAQMRKSMEEEEERMRKEQEEEEEKLRQEYEQQEKRIVEERAIKERFEEKKKGRREDYELQMDLLQEAEVICTTSIAAGSDFLSDFSYKMILVDEVAQSTELSTIVPIVLRGATRMVLVGDHCQLPPTVMSLESETRGLSLSLYSRLVGQGVEPYFLNTQYRSHPKLAEFSAGAFYGGQLRSGTPADQRPPCKGFPWPNPDVPVCFVDCQKPEDHEGDSKTNPGEVDQVFHLLQHVLAAEELGCLDIGVVTPYQAQVRALRQRIRPGIAPLLRRLKGSQGWDRSDWQRYEAKHLEIGSIDGFQGREKELIIFSAVRSNRRGMVGFLADWRRLNVMLTRAKRGLIVVGTAMTLKHDPCWQQWLEFCEDHDAIIRVEKVAEVLKDYDEPKKQQWGSWGGGGGWGGGGWGSGSWNANADSAGDSNGGNAGGNKQKGGASKGGGKRQSGKRGKK